MADDAQAPEASTRIGRTRYPTESSINSFATAADETITADTALPTSQTAASLAEVWHSSRSLADVLEGPDLAADETVDGSADGRRTPTITRTVIPEIIPLPPSPRISREAVAPALIPLPLSPRPSQDSPRLSSFDYSPALNEKPSWSTFGGSTLVGFGSSSWEDLDGDIKTERRVADWDGEKRERTWADSSSFDGVTDSIPLLQRRFVRYIIGLVILAVIAVAAAVPAAVLISRKSSSSSDDALSSSSSSMAPAPSTTSSAPLILPTSTARMAPIPDYVASLYTIGADPSCRYSTLDNKTEGFGANGDGKSNARYCGDRAFSPSVVYWRSNMDIDCDGASGQVAGCMDDPSFYPATSMLINGTTSLDAIKTPFVVITDTPQFRPAKYNLNGFEVVAIVCNSSLTFGIFGDTTSYDIIGEASLNTGRTCWGDSVDADDGHFQADVLYAAFPGVVDSYYGSNYTHLAMLGNQAILDRLSDVSSW